MPLLQLFIKTFVGALLLWCALLCWHVPMHPRRLSQQAWRSLALLCLASASLLLLSGCGTAPSPAQTKQPVPAALRVPPKASV